MGNRVTLGAPTSDEARLLRQVLDGLQTSLGYELPSGAFVTAAYLGENGARLTRKLNGHVANSALITDFAKAESLAPELGENVMLVAVDRAVNGHGVESFSSVLSQRVGIAVAVGIGNYRDSFQQMESHIWVPFKSFLLQAVAYLHNFMEATRLRLAAA